VKLEELATEPPAVTISIFPVVAPSGTVVVTCVSEFTANVAVVPNGRSNDRTALLETFLMTTVKGNYTFITWYAVSIVVGGSLYYYGYMCSNHDEAMHMALAEHLNEGHPLPPGSVGTVVGLCADLNSKCGKLRVRRYNLSLTSKSRLS
jgi:hypothetical protein